MAEGSTARSRSACLGAGGACFSLPLPPGPSAMQLSRQPTPLLPSPLPYFILSMLAHCSNGPSTPHARAHTHTHTFIVLAHVTDYKNKEIGTHLPPYECLCQYFTRIHSNSMSIFPWFWMAPFIWMSLAAVEHCHSFLLTPMFNT